MLDRRIAVDSLLGIMRILLTLVLVFSLMTFAYSFIGEGSVIARWSNAQAVLAEAPQTIPKPSLNQVDGIILSLRHEWQTVRLFALLTSVTALISLICAFKAKKNDKNHDA